MLENMSGVVGYAMHADRLAVAQQDARIAEARATRKTADAHRVHQGWRLTAAKALIALATRLAPMAPTPTTSVSA